MAQLAGKKKILFILAIILIAGLSAFFRLDGLNWDESRFLHPDERFLIQVADSISLTRSFGSWLDTKTSSMNPANQGFEFYVYGTFPLLLIKTVESLFAAKAGLASSEFLLLSGRFLSAFFDLLTLLTAGWLSWRLWRKPAAVLLTMTGYGLLTGAIQQSHYFTVDSYSTFFATLSLAIIFGSRDQDRRQAAALSWLISGAALGTAAACKISAVFFIVFPVLFLMIACFQDRKISLHAVVNLLCLLIGSAFAFRILQPYAFGNPSFFDFRFSSQWLESLFELSAQSSGKIDFPPAWQWVNKPPFYAFQTLFVYGMGLPLGLLVAAAMIRSLEQAMRYKDRLLLAIVAGSLLFSLWQSTQFSKMMRYLLPICPHWMVLLGSLAGWGDSLSGKKKQLMKAAALTCLGLALGWVVAFTSIYRTPHTRIQASRWIYENIPAPVELQLADGEGKISTIGVATANALEISAGQSRTIPITVRTGDQIRTLEWDNQQNSANEACQVKAALCEDSDCSIVLAEILVDPIQDSRAFFQQAAIVQSDQTWLKFSVDSGTCDVRWAGDTFLYLIRDGLPRYEFIDGLANWLSSDSPLAFEFQPAAAGKLRSVRFPHWSGILDTDKALTISLQSGGGEGELITDGELTETSDGLTLAVQPEIPLTASTSYKLRIDTKNPEDWIHADFGRIASESSWDDALPLRLDGKVPYGSETSLYGNLIDLDLLGNFDLFKLEKLLAQLEKADYFVISSNRIYGAVDNAPQRFQQADEIYWNLIGCKASSFADCLANLSIETQSDRALFSLAAAFESEPALFGLSFSTQKAEEAFTVYDHPKVFVFKKNSDVSFDQWRKQLDLSGSDKSFEKTPLEYSHMQQLDGMLTESASLLQQSGGTWSQLFQRDALINSNEFLTVLLWYGLIWLIGLVFLPLTNWIFGSLRDKGYGVSRLFGLLSTGFVVWRLCFSVALYSPKSISLIFLGFLILNGIVFLFRREKMVAELRPAWKYMLQSEAVFLACFLFFLFIRLGNPDLWHLYKGGEKPMDFSYFNAVLKSSTFPPYDPWFAGGTLNYYYYGFFLSGLLVKWIGLIPATAYNLILPTWYAFLGAGAFSVGSSLSHLLRKAAPENADRAGLTGLISVLFMQVIGNLGTLKVIAVEAAELGCAGITETMPGFEKIGCFVSGVGNLIKGQHFQMYPGDWYWLPSRAIPGEPITEFPFFTFLYGDPHAHLFALPVTVLALAWLTAILIQRADQTLLQKIVSLISGALIIGSLIPTNTWDTPTYLLIACISLIGLGCQTPYFRIGNSTDGKNSLKQKVFSILLVLGILCGLSVLFFKPFLDAGSRETAIDVWKGSRTPLWSYFMHWGLFLFAILSWYIMQTLDWLDSVRWLDFKQVIDRYKPILIAAGAALLAALVACATQQVWTAVISLPMMFWSLILMIRKEKGAASRLLLFISGTAFFITLFVEFFSLRGDLGRMNMVFKLYLQAWVLFSLVAAVGITEVLNKLNSRELKESVSWKRQTWIVMFGLLMIGTLSYTLFASVDKIRDRMSAAAPHTLDGMRYMESSFYYQDGFMMDLSQDYAAIQWMQDHVQGSPVIVEGNPTEYKWGNRYTVYTGLPGVIGWNYHQRQQRGPMSDQVWERVNAVTEFYNEPDPAAANAFLDRYQVQYIIVGQMERGMFTAEGIEKFAAGSGIFWDQVYQAQDTAIYEVRKN